MTREEKQLLLNDLCARLPYEVKIDHFGVIRDLLGVIPSFEIAMVGYNMNDYEDSAIEDIKPYLRPMSSMNEEETDEYDRLVMCNASWVVDDWLHKNHFDYRKLILKGLALEAPEGMYKNK